MTGIDADLPAEEQQVATAAGREVKDAGILQKELTLLGIVERVWSEIKVGQVHIGVGEIGADRGVGDEIGAQSELGIQSCGVQPAPAGGKTGAGHALRQMLEAQQSVRF